MFTCLCSLVFLECKTIQLANVIVNRKSNGPKIPI